MKANCENILIITRKMALIKFNMQYMLTLQTTYSANCQTQQKNYLIKIAILILQRFKISLMIKDISQYFNKFYQTVLKQHINDAIIHSQWMYFLSMFKNLTIDKERIELYLGILSNEKGKKNAQKTKDNSLSSLSNTQSIRSQEDSKIKLIKSSQDHIDLSDIKLQKRFSENWKTKVSAQSQKIAKDCRLSSDPVSLKKIESAEEEPNYKSIQSLQDESINMRFKNEPLYALPSYIPNSYAYLKHKSANQMAIQTREAKIKQRNNRLCQISSRLVNIFEGTKLRV